MRYSYSIEHKELLFKVAARTSRGEYLTHNIWIITINDMLSGRSGTGEAAPLPDLSVDASSNYENILFQFCNEFCADPIIRVDGCAAVKLHQGEI